MIKCACQVCRYINTYFYYGGGGIIIDRQSSGIILVMNVHGTETRILGRKNAARYGTVRYAVLFWEFRMVQNGTYVYISVYRVELRGSETAAWPVRHEIPSRISASSSPSQSTVRIATGNSRQEDLRALLLLLHFLFSSFLPATKHIHTYILSVQPMTQILLRNVL